MLALGADTEARDGAFRSPLHLAARADAPPTLPSTVKGADASAAPPSPSILQPRASWTTSTKAGANTRALP